MCFTKQSSVFTTLKKVFGIKQAFPTFTTMFFTFPRTNFMFCFPFIFATLYLKRSFWRWVSWYHLQRLSILTGVKFCTELNHLSFNFIVIFVFPLYGNCQKGETALDRASTENIKEVLTTAIQLHKDLRVVNKPVIQPVTSLRKPVKPYVPKCDPKFKVSCNLIPHDPVLK